MSNLNLLTKDWTTDKDGNTFAYGTKWKPVQPFRGRFFPRPRYDIEMIMYKSLRGLPVPKGFVIPPGKVDAKHHYMEFVREMFDYEDSIWKYEWNPYAVRMLDAKLDNNYLMVAGHQRSGKSEFVGLWSVTNFLFDPFNTKCLLTSLTLKSARGKIWAKVTECWQQACRHYAKCYGIEITDGERYMPGKLLNSQGIIKYLDNGVETEQAGIELVPGNVESARDSAEKIQGYHRNRMFAGLDELASLDHGLMRTIQTNIFTDKNADITGVFNPDSYFDPAGVASEPFPGGWASLAKDAMEWRNKYGLTIRLCGSSSPNLAEDGNKYPYLLSREEYDTQKIALGERSKDFCKMYEAIWSAEGSAESIYSEHEIMDYKGMQKIEREWIEPPVRCAFLDPSFAMDGDSSIAAFGICGQARIDGETKKILCQDGPVVRLDADIDVKKGKPEQIVAKFIKECRDREIHPKMAGLDVTGSQLYNLLARDWSPDLLQVNFGEAPSDIPISRTDPTPAKDKFTRKVSEIWYLGKALLRSGQLKGLTEDVVSEMVKRNYETVSNGKIQVEPKDKMKARSLKSPDRADALLGLAYLCRERLGLLAKEMPKRDSGKFGWWKPGQMGPLSPTKKKTDLNSCLRPGIVFGSPDGKALWKK
jgi:hypothetical protein